MNAQTLIQNLLNSGTLKTETEVALQRAIEALNLMDSIEGYFHAKTSSLVTGKPDLVQSVAQLEEVAQPRASTQEQMHVAEQTPASISASELPVDIESFIDDVGGQLNVPVQRHTSKSDSKAPAKGAGAKWTPEEDAQLKAEFTQGLHATEIAQRHGRSVPSILIRLCDKLSLISEAKKDELVKKYRNQQAGATPAAAGNMAPEKGLSGEDVEAQMAQFIQTAY